MRDVFEQNLKELHEMMIEMGHDCQSIIEQTYEALIKDNRNIIQEIRHYENKINHLERNIESKCMQLLLLQAPVASDLRKVSSAMKMITDMERIGDHAYDIAEIIDKNQELPSHIQDLPYREMAKEVKQMIDACIKAFVNNDKELAYRVIEEDDHVDAYFTEIYNGLVESISRKDTSALDLLMIGKYYERIGDHVTNIAEWVVYSLTNEHMVLDEK